MSLSDSHILQLNEVCESNVVSEPELRASPCAVCYSCCALPCSITHVEEVEVFVQDDIDEVDLPSCTTLPNISAAREAREYDRSRRRIRETAKLAASRRREQAARFEGKVQPFGMGRKEKGGFGTRRVRNRANTASLLEDAMEVLVDEPPSLFEPWSWQPHTDVVIVPTTEVLISSQEDRRSGSIARPFHDAPHHSGGVDSCSHPLVESNANLESVTRQQLDIAAVHDTDPSVDSPLQTSSTAREIRAYEYNRRRVKNRAKLAINRSRKQDRFKKLRKPTVKPIGRKRTHLLVDLGDDSAFPDEYDEECSIPLEVSLTSILSEEPSGRPFYVSDVSYTKMIRKRKGTFTHSCAGFTSLTLTLEPGFEMVAQVPAVIVLDDELAGDLEHDEPWEHVWNDDLLDGHLLFTLN
jgi:hypothetical protein